MILARIELRGEVLEKHPRLYLSFLSDQLDDLIPNERTAQIQRVTDPPSPLTLIAKEEV